MNPHLIRNGILCLVCAISGQTLAAISPSVPDSAVVQHRLAMLTLPFVPNAGQWDHRAAFAAHTFAGTVFVTTEGQLVYSLPGKESSDPLTNWSSTRPTSGQRFTKHAQRSRGPGAVLTETLVNQEGRTLRLIPQGLDPQQTKVSYFTGNAASRRGALETFERVSLGEPLPGITMVLRASGSNVEKILTVAPDCEPGAIRVRVEGADGLEIGTGGELIIHSSNGPLTLSAPVAFQEDARGQRNDVGVHYALAAQQQTYGFVVDDYDRSRPLVIDPLLQTTYLGGGSDDTISAIAIDPVTGEVLVAGLTRSTDLPCVTTATAGCRNGAQSTHAGVAVNYDGFVARLNASLTTLVQVTYLGGPGDDYITAIAIHPISGEVLVAGDTGSGSFPCTTVDTAGCGFGAQSSYGGGSADGFVARFSGDLTSLRQATYFGGTGMEYVTDMIIHPVSGEVLIAGFTTSTTLRCTTTATAGCAKGAQPAHAADGGLDDGYIARYSADLTTLLQATFLGGGGEDQINTIAIDPATGEVLVGGGTQSTDFPCTSAVTGCAAGAQAAHSAINSGTDGFVARLNASLTTLLQATYFGGGHEYIGRMAFHPISGELVVAGNTFSFNLPCANTATAGCGNGAQPFYSNSSGPDGFVARISASLTRLLQATYLKGSSIYGVFSMAIHPLTGEVLAAGNTPSTDLPCTTPSTNGCATGAQSAHAVDNVTTDGYIARLSPDLTRLLQATYLGGSNVDAIYAIALHPLTGELLVAGTTASADLPCTTSATSGCATGAQATFGGNQDGFVARISADLTLNDNIPDPFSYAGQTNVPQLSIRTSNPGHITGITGSADLYIEGQPGSTYCVSSTNSCSCNISGGFTATRGSIANNSFVCLRHTASSALNQLTRTDLHIGGGVGTFAVTTGTFLAGGNCAFDVDGNGSVDALTDGLIILRAMFGLTGTSVTNAAVGAGATRSTWAQIQPYLNGNCGTNFAP